MASKHKLPSGSVFEITPLPYEEAWSVVQTVVKTVETLKLDIKGIDFAAFQAMDVLTLAHPLCAVLSSKDILAAAHLCFKRCTYDGRKVDAQTFEQTEARADFLFAAFFALKENVSPFFGGLASFLKMK